MNEQPPSHSRATRELLHDRNLSATAFNTHVVSTSNSLIDVPSTYPFNTERCRRTTAGTVDDTNFTDAEGEYKLQVNGNAGDEHVFSIRKRIPYHPNYELLWGQAFYMENALSPGQVLQVAYTNPAWDEGYIVEITPSGRHVYILNDGDDVDKHSWGEQQYTEDPYGHYGDIDVTNPQVIRTFLNWYGDGAARYTLAHATDESNVRNSLIGRTANKSGVATSQIGLQIKVRLKCESDTDSNTVNVLSSGAATRGGNSVSNRIKSSHDWSLTGVQPDTYEPLVAIRRRDGFDEVVTELHQFRIIPEDTMEVSAVAMLESEITASGWDVPPQMDPLNTAVEKTTDISDIPLDANGNPDGRLIGLTASTSQGQASTPIETDSEAEFFPDEAVVFVGQTDTASDGAVSITQRTKQYW